MRSVVFTQRAAACFLLLILDVSTSQPPKIQTEWTSESYPYPPNALCGNYTSICDPDRILGSRDIVTELESLIEEVNKESCACGDCKPLQKDTEGNEGFRIGIAAVGKLMSQASGNTTWEQIDIDTFAGNILRKWHLGSCRNGLIIAVSNETGQYATAVDETTQLRLHRECLERRGESEADRLIRNGQTAAGLRLLIQEYKVMIKEGSCLMSKTIWLIIAFILAPIGIIFAICYLACKSSNYVIKTEREKRARQMMHKKLEEYSSRSVSESSSSSSDDGVGCSTSRQYESIPGWKRDVPTVSQVVTKGDLEHGYRTGGAQEGERRQSDVWVKARPN